MPHGIVGIHRAILISWSKVAFILLAATQMASYFG
jgi:hypothetical protein